MKAIRRAHDNFQAAYTVFEGLLKWNEPEVRNEPEDIFQG
jgi:hypothetical protein